MIRQRTVLAAALGVPAACASTAFAGGFGGFATPVPLSTGDGPHDVAVGDIDGDGDPDLVAANHWADTLRVLINSGGGTLAAAGTYATVNGVQSVALGDIDGDGRLDVASVGEYSQSEVSVRLNNGHGGFGAETRYATGPGPRCVAMGDLDGDGFADVAVANRDDGTLSRYLSNGDGTLQPQVTFFLGGAPHGRMELADLDGAAGLDVVNVSWGTNEVKVLYNLGQGAFGPPASYPVGEMPFDLALADFNGDGHLDITTANFWDGTVSVLLGSGEGTFAPGPLIDVAASNIEGVVAGDFDRDGHDDIVVINGLWSLVHVVIGNGDGTFQDPFDDDAGGMQRAIAAADFDGDGDLDVTLAHLADDTVSTMENMTPVPQVPGDLDGDGDVDILDLIDLLEGWGACPGGPVTCPADLDGDGAVGMADLLVLLGNWG